MNVIFRDVTGRRPGLNANVSQIKSTEETFLGHLEEFTPLYSITAEQHLRERLKQLSAQYSLGATPAEIASGLQMAVRMSAFAQAAAVASMEPWQYLGIYKFGRDVGMFRNWLWLVSLAVALDVEDSVFDDVVAAVEPVWADRLIGLLIRSRRPDFEVGEEFAFKALGRGLAKAWDAPDPVKALESYLAKWPSYYKREGWTDAAQYAQIEGDRRYFGLWAFETVGVVKALNLDDTRLLSNEYYPAGILHADL